MLPSTYELSMTATLFCPTSEFEQVILFNF